MGYAFISYSTHNTADAEIFRRICESHHIDTWMAPHNIPAGSQYAQVISKAIKDCSCFVLLLTEHAQNSVWVAKEVERAINHKKTIIPVMLEPITLNDEFEFYISSNQIVKVNGIDEHSPEVVHIMNSLASLVGVSTPAQTSSLENNEAIPEVSEEDLIIELNDENGDPVRLMFLDLMEYQGDEYVVLLPQDQNDTEVVILKVEDAGDDMESYSSVDDDTVAILFEIFKEKFKDVFHFTD